MSIHYDANVYVTALFLYITQQVEPHSTHMFPLINYNSYIPFSKKHIVDLLLRMPSKTVLPKIFGTTGDDKKQEKAPKVAADR